MWQLRFGTLRIITLLAFSLTIFNLGCGSAKTASNRTFAKVIGKHLQEHPEYYFFKPRFNPLEWMSDGKGAPSPMDELVKLGLLRDTKSPIDRYEIQASGQALLEKDMMVGTIMLRFAMTDGGVEVTRFTTPQNFMGRTVSEVEYKVRWKPTALLTDRKYDRVRAALKGEIDRVKKETQTPSIRKTTLVQFSDGWHVADE